ncbi:MAG: orotidine-5'-phosphate decarboxylase [bacterium]
MDNFADRLTTRTRELGHPLCIGLDPYLDQIPEAFRGASEAETVRNFFTEFLSVAHSKIAIVKPQISLFERMGIPGLEVLQALIEKAQSLGLLVLLDAKRGDIGETARGYAEAYLSNDGFLNVDAVTVNPYMGLDAVEPFVEQAEANGKGVVVLVRNSNPGSDAFQLLEINGKRFFEVVAQSLSEFEDRLVGKSGWSSLAVTVSARSPEDSLRIRQHLPKSLLLVLGYGAQGGDASSSVAGLTRSKQGFEGGIVNSSRSVLYPSQPGVNSWESAIENSVAVAIRGLREAEA